MIYVEDVSWNMLPMLSCSTEEEWDIAVRAVKDIAATNNIKNLFGGVINPFKHSEKHGAMPIDSAIYHSLMNILSAFEIKLIPEWGTDCKSWFDHLDKHKVTYYRGE